MLLPVALAHLEAEMLVEIVVLVLHNYYLLAKNLIKVFQQNGMVGHFSTLMKGIRIIITMKARIGTGRLLMLMMLTQITMEVIIVLQVKVVVVLLHV